MVTDFKVNIEINWSALSALKDLNWDAILAAFSVNVNKNSLTSVKHL